MLLQHCVDIKDIGSCESGWRGNYQRITLILSGKIFFRVLKRILNLGFKWKNVFFVLLWDAEPALYPH